MKHYVSALVENKAGVLARMTGLFARRGFNINSLAVGETEDPAVSRVTIVVDGDDYIADQVTKQLSKLIDVRRVKQLEAISPNRAIMSETALVKVRVAAKQTGIIYEMAHHFLGDCTVNNLSLTEDPKHPGFILKLTGDSFVIETTIKTLAKAGVEILEVVRTGTIALDPGPTTIYDE